MNELDPVDLQYRTTQDPEGIYSIEHFWDALA